MLNSVISLRYSDCLFMNLKRCLWAINCLRIYCHLQTPKTTSRNLRKVSRSTKGTTQSGDAILGVNMAARKPWKHLEFNLTFSGKTLLLSAELENILIDNSRNMLFI